MTQALKVKRGRDSMVRIDHHTQLVLTELSRQRNEDKKKIIAHSVEMFRRQTMLEQLCEGYRELRSDPEAWAQEQADRAAVEHPAISDLDNE